jgi:Ca-activated chloride channel family protein
MRVLFTALLVFMGIATVFGQSERSLIREGNRTYKQKKFADAEVNYRKALEKNRDVKQGEFNLGDALYKQDRFDEAANQYRDAATKLSDPKAKAEALYNLGNAQLRNKKIPESIASYKEALKLNPNDLDTKYNLEYAKMLLQKQQQQQQNQKKDQKQNKQKQDQEKQQKDQQQKQDQQKQAQQKQQQEEKKQQISKQDAERILEALKNEEKDVQKKLHKKVPARVKVEKDW